MLMVQLNNATTTHKFPPLEIRAPHFKFQIHSNSHSSLQSFNSKKQKPFQLILFSTRRAYRRNGFLITSRVPPPPSFTSKKQKPFQLLLFSARRSHRRSGLCSVCFILVNSEAKFLVQIRICTPMQEQCPFSSMEKCLCWTMEERIMYQSLNSPGQLTKWSSNAGDPCGENWKGITCSGSKVTEINLLGLGLSGGIGYDLTSLKELTNFDISNNNLGNQLPYNLPPNLQSLNIAGCGFSGALPYSISLMTSLKSLNAARNQLNGQLHDMFGKLSALSKLDLSFNSFTGDLPESLSSLSSVSEMYLQNNQFTGTIDVLADLPLKNLNVANNKFTGWVPSRLKNINLQKDGNSWNSGSAPPPPPNTPGSGGGSRNRQPSGNRSSSTDKSNDGRKKSGISGGAIAGIVISILVVNAIIAFFLLKKRSRKQPADIEKIENQPFAPVASQPQGVQGRLSYP